MENDNGLVQVGSYDNRDTDAMDLGSMERILREEINRFRRTSVMGPSGEEVLLTPDELMAMDPIEGTKDVRVRYELQLRTFRFPQVSAMQMRQPAFRAFIAYNMQHIMDALAKYQPSFDWVVVATMIDAVSASRIAANPSTLERDAGLVQASMIGQLQQQDPEKSKPIGVQRGTGSGHDESQWRWYVRIVAADMSGGNDYQDTWVQVGGDSPASKYSDGRALRNMPAGSRRNRAEAVKLIQRLGANPVRVGPPGAAPGEIVMDALAAAVELLKDGTNPILVARALKLPIAQVAEIAAGLDGHKEPRRRAPRKASSPAAGDAHEPPPAE